jgi:K+ transporter
MTKPPESSANPLLAPLLRHPRLAAWAVLSLGMVAILIFEARDVGLQAGQWAAMIVATVLVAGACIWIVSWEEGDDATDTADTPADATAAAKPADVATPSAAPAAATPAPADEQPKA